MKNIMLIACCFIIFGSPSTFAGFKIPDYQKLKLKNGLTVYLMEQHEVPLIDIRMVTKVGAINDQKSYGLANLTGNALSYGSGNLSKQEVEDIFAFHGANFTNNVNSETSSSNLSVAAKDINKLLPIFKNIISKPRFNTNDFEKEKKRYIDQLKQSREQPRNIINSIFNRMYYKEHLYGNPVQGDVNSVGKISLEQVKSFYYKFYSPSNSALIIAGDFNTKKMTPLIRKLFSSWESRSVPIAKLNAPMPPTQPNVWLINKNDAIETTFMIGGKGIPSNHPDSVSIQVINTILGARFTSWLNDELRVNSGLTYGARSRFISHSQTGTFAISTFTKKETTFEAIDLALKTYHRVWNKGIDAKTLESAKAYVKGQFPPRYETSTQLAQLLSRIWSQNLSDSFINDFQKNVDLLNVEKANSIAQSIFPKENLQFVLIGKADDIKNKAREYGKLREMDINAFEY